MTYYGDVERVVAASERIAGKREDLDRDLLYLLAVFSGQERWGSPVGHKRRTRIVLSSEGVLPRTVASLWRGLARLEERPRTPEEEVVHDALRLQGVGGPGIARGVPERGRGRGGG